MAEMTKKEFDTIFPIVDPSELIGHKLLEYQPKNRHQEMLLKCIREGIRKELPAFRAPYMDPSEEDGKIVFKPGNRPALGHTVLWWNQKCREFMPSKNSRPGTDLHWAALLGKQMKYLVEKNKYSVEKAWEIMCDNSRGVGHYYNSKNRKDGVSDPEPTGSHKVGLFYDLASTFKLLEQEGWGVPLIAGGDCNWKTFDDLIALGHMEPLLDANAQSEFWESDENIGHNNDIGGYVLSVLRPAFLPYPYELDVHRIDTYTRHCVGWLVLDV